MAATMTSVANLAVEISGWDDDKEFFVETSPLEWGAAGRRSVLLHSRLHAGSMVFLRLIAHSGSGKGFPVGHKVDAIEPSGLPETFRIALVESQPRRATHPGTGTVDATIDPLEHLIGVGERTRP